MDWKLFAQLAVTLVVAVLGGWIGHYLLCVGISQVSVENFSGLLSSGGI